MSTEQFNIHCGLCDEPVEIPADAKTEHVLSCPCGNSDDIESIRAEALNSLGDRYGRQLLDGIMKPFKNSKAFKVKTSPTPNRVRRWYAKLVTA